MKGDTRCVEGRVMRHDPQWDDPYLETDIGQCPECEGHGCLVCEDCGTTTPSLNEADQCDDCHDKWEAAQIAYWRPLYEGEKLAGLLPQTPEERG